MPTPEKPQNMPQEEWDEELAHVVDRFYYRQSRDRTHESVIKTTGYRVGERVHVQFSYEAGKTPHTWTDTEGVEHSTEISNFAQDWGTGTIREAKVDDRSKAKLPQNTVVFTVDLDEEFAARAIYSSTMAKIREMKHIKSFDCPECGTLVEDSDDYLCDACRTKLS